jgi:hypothetical protein
VSGHPYGPNTAMIRRFLVRLAGLGTSDRAAVLQRYTTLCGSRAWDIAETAMATSIERSGREPQRDAMSGPLLQLVRTPAHDEGDRDPAPGDDNPLASLDPVAEPALAALLALLVQDLLSAEQVQTLYAPFADAVPMGELLSAASM